MAASSFAWWFVLFSTSTGNANYFARYIGIAFQSGEYPSQWLQKYIACWVVVGIFLIHYRLVNIGILANNVLASLKVIALLLFLLIGMVGGLKKTNGAGAHDYDDTKMVVKAPTNVALALFLVLYSYQGWENASNSALERSEAPGAYCDNLDYITAEISGNEEERKRILKKGVLIAVGAVSALYILLNLIMVSF